MSLLTGFQSFKKTGIGFLVTFKVNKIMVFVSDFWEQSPLIN